MDIYNILLVLVFILPGMLSKKTCSLFGIPKREKESDFKQFTEYVFISFPILLISTYIFSFIYSFKDFTEFQLLMKTADSLWCFVIILLIISPIYGIAKAILHKPFFIVLNKIRKKFKIVEITDESCWTNFILEDNDFHYVEVDYHDKIIRGFVQNVSLPNEDQELLLGDFDTANEYKDKFNEIKRTYINFEKNILINEYDKTEYENYCKELKENNKIGKNEKFELEVGTDIEAKAVT